MTAFKGVLKRSTASLRSISRISKSKMSNLAIDVNFGALLALVVVVYLVYVCFCVLVCVLGSTHAYERVKRRN